MSSRFKRFATVALAAALMVFPALSQLGVFVQGVVKDQDGKIVQGAVVSFESAETKSHSDVKTDKKGHYINSMKSGQYTVTVTVDGKMRAQVKGYPAGANDDPLNFDLKAPGAAPAPAMAAGGAPAAGGAKPSKEEEKAQKEREAQLAKNKELNDTYSAGKAAMENKNWDEAITQLTKAGELGPTQQAVWASLAESYVAKAKASRGDDAKTAYDKGFEAYDKLLALAPTDAGTFNNYALALAADKRLDDAKVKLGKAIELDPPGAGKYHYNMGALLYNANATDGAIDEFKKAIDSDPTYAEAYFQYGSALMGKATTDTASGKIVAAPGTVEALQKYLQLKPDGPNADSAKALIAALGSTVQVNYKDPNAPAPKTNKKGK